MFIDIVTTILAGLHVVAATLVTLHVLLAHRDVRSSIGWIGLAWLSPFIGSFTYLALGINRVQRRASRINLGPGTGKRDVKTAGAKRVEAAFLPQIETLSRAADVISGVPLTHGNSLELLENGDAAYPQMLDAIANSKVSVALSSYIFAHDRIGSIFADALIRAHRRGVLVRVLVDGIGSGYFRSPLFHLLSAAGVPVARFLHEWAPWQMPFINLRNHKKVLVVDGQIGFTGGMNISDRNTNEGSTIRVRDTHAKFGGPIVRHLMLSFASDWEFTTGESLAGAHWWPEVKSAGKYAMRGITSGPDESIGRIETLWATAIEQAQQRVRILTPYFLPEDALMAVLRRAALRGVEVEIILPEYTNHWYVNWAVRAHLQTLFVDGISCFLTPAPFDHSKLMSVDGQWAALGSPNWDARSMRLNFELLLECYGGDVVDDIDALIDQKLNGSKKLTVDMLSSRALPVKLRDASARLFLPYL